MAPEIDGLLTDLSKKMNQLNQFQIGSCQAIKQYVGTTPDTRNMDMEQRAQVFGSALTGSYGSFFNAKEDTQTSPANTKAAYDAACTVNAALCLDSAGKPVLKSDFNLVYDALERAGGYSNEEIELYISLFGTLTFISNSSDIASGFTTEYFKPTITWEDFLGPLSGTHTMMVRECPSGSYCIPYASATDEGTPRTTVGMTAIVYEQLNKLKDAIVTRTALMDPKALQVIAMTSTPIYQMIAQSIHSGRGSTKTVVVEITRVFRHPLFRKVVHTSKRVKAHDEVVCQIGDQVQIVESRPLSRDKRWVVESIVKREIRTEDTGVADLKVEDDQS